MRSSLPPHATRRADNANNNAAIQDSLMLDLTSLLRIDSSIPGGNCNPDERPRVDPEVARPQGPEHLLEPGVVPPSRLRRSRHELLKWHGGESHPRVDDCKRPVIGH